MTDFITVTGLVATDPKHIVTSEGLAITSFRLASAQRRFDRATERWVDVDTNWYTVSSFRQLAMNASNSVKKGERVVVTGRVRIREWQGSERSGTNVDIEADSIGHDLAWGTASFSRTITASTSAEPEAAHADDRPVDAAVDAGVDASTDTDAAAHAPAWHASAEPQPATPF